MSFDEDLNDYSNIPQLNPQIGRTNAPVGDEIDLAIRKQLPLWEAALVRLGRRLSRSLTNWSRAVDQQDHWYIMLASNKGEKGKNSGASSPLSQYLNFEAELERLEMDLAVSLAWYTRIMGYRDRSKVALAPHKLLPTELIREIMVQAIKEPAAIPLDISVHDTRMAVARVCSTWREIIIGTPEFWKDLVLSYTTQSSELRVSRLANAWLARCPNYPLTLSVIRNAEPQIFHAHPGALPISQRDYAINNVITPNAFRVRDLRMVIALNSAEKLLSLPGASFEALETLHITIKYRPISSFIDFETPTIFSRAPRLREIKFWLRGHYNPLTLAFPWGQLTRLILAGELPPRVCLAILNLCPLLQHCAFDHIVSGNHSPILANITIPNPPLILPNLESLDIQFDPDYFSHFFNDLSLPNLTSLKLVRFYCWDRTFWTSPDVVAFLSSLSATLKEFTYEDHYAEVVNTEYPQMEPLLNCLPNALSVTFPTDYFIPSSTLENISKGSILPQAEHLSFHSRTNRHMLLQMVELRYILAQRADGLSNLATIKLVEGRKSFAESFSIQLSPNGYLVTESRGRGQQVRAN